MRRNKTLGNAADCFAVILAGSIPVSTSATAVLAGLLLLAVIPNLTIAELRAECSRPASALPWMLVGLGIAGMLWAVVPLEDRWHGLVSFLKLAIIPLLAIHFGRSQRGHWALIAYFAACLVALFASSAVVAMPHLYWRSNEMFPTPFKSPATQSGEFVACIAVLLYVAIDAWRERRWQLAALSLIVSAGFLSIIAFTATARTPLVVAPVLLLLLAARKFSLRGAAAFVAIAVILGGVLLYLSPYLSGRATAIWTEIQSYQTRHELTSSGERLEFWKKSAAIVSRAPLIGHGTGSVQSQMALETRGQSGPYATATPNPHQQTLVVAIQLGLAGAFLLWAMWIVHGATFFRDGLVAWIGLVVVVQNIVGSLFNSHLFDFTQGWTYVIGVGVVMGMLRRQANV